MCGACITHRKEQKISLENMNRRDHLHNINTSYTKRVTEGIKWIHLGQDREKIEDSCEHGNKTLDSRYGRKFLN